MKLRTLTFFALKSALEVAFGPRSRIFASSGMSQNSDNGRRPAPLGNDISNNSQADQIGQKCHEFDDGDGHNNTIQQYIDELKE
jgi:hypothetical protein